MLPELWNLPAHDQHVILSAGVVYTFYVGGLLVLNRDSLIGSDAGREERRITVEFPSNSVEFRRVKYTFYVGGILSFQLRISLPNRIGIARYPNFWTCVVLRMRSCQGWNLAKLAVADVLPWPRRLQPSPHTYLVDSLHIAFFATLF